MLLASPKSNAREDRADSSVVSWNELSSSILVDSRDHSGSSTHVREDYFQLVEAYASAGGTLPVKGFKRVMELVPRLLLDSKESTAGR